MSSVGAIILAAGGSSRMGELKQLLKFGATTLLGNAIAAAVESDCDPVIVVLGANSDKISSEETLASVSLVVINDNWQEGISSSIHRGITALTESRPDISAAIFIACDQPYIDSATINKLIQRFHSGECRTVAASYADTVGIPALFCRTLFPELLALTGDSGAKKVIHSHRSELATIDFAGGACDIDTHEEYRSIASAQVKA